MKKAIVFVRSQLWGHRAVDDLLFQEKKCLAFAQTNGLKVVKVFRQPPWRKSKKGLFPAAIEFIRECGDIDSVLIYRPRNLDHIRSLWIHKVSEFRNLGAKVVFVINQKITK